MMRSAFSSDLDNLAKFRLRRKKVPNRTELVAQRVPGLDKQMLDMAAALLVLLGNHALQDLSRESPFGKLSIDALARELQEAVIAEEQSDEVKQELAHRSRTNR
jgi:uracil-DNA glycosylase